MFELSARRSFRGPPRRRRLCAATPPKSTHQVLYTLAVHLKGGNSSILFRASPQQITSGFANRIKRKIYSYYEKPVLKSSYTIVRYDNKIGLNFFFFDIFLLFFTTYG